VSACLLCVRLESYAADCNDNGVEDADDIAAETSADCNTNGIPDECETVPDGTPAPEPIASVGFSETLIDLDRFEPHSSAMASFNNDGWPDMATMDGEDRVMILLGDGEGSFKFHEIHTLRGTSEIIWIAVDNLDGDGDLDIVAVDERTDNFAILLNDGEGNFEQSDVIIDAGRNLSFVDTGDLDGDGSKDLVIADQGAGRIAVYRNRGDGTFFPRDEFDAGFGPRGLIVANLDEETGPDVAVVGLSTLSVFLNSGDWENPADGFRERVDYETGSTSFVMAADFSGSDDDDLVVARQGGEALELFENDGEGGFASRLIIDLGQQPRSVIAVDIDRDGVCDLVTGNERNDTISVVLNHGDWIFDEPRTIDVGKDPRFVIAGDIDRDGDNDIVAANHSSYDLSILYTEKVTIYDPTHLESICTPREFFDVSRELDGRAFRRCTEFVVPFNAADDELLPPLFRSALYDSTLEFLQQVYRGRFGDLDAEGYHAQFVARETREYLVGRFWEIDRDDETVFAFDIEYDEADGPADLVETTRVYRRLRDAFSLSTPLYYPSSPEAFAEADLWEEPVFDFFFGGPRFRRGDLAIDGRIVVTDAVVLLEHLFQGGPPLGCAAAADANADESVDVADAIMILLHLFGGVASLPDPFETCGLDRRSDGLTCESFSPCDGVHE